MRKISTLLLIIVSITGYSQYYGDYNINFEDTSQFFRLEIDTISNPNNIWQIGEPQKTIFTSAYSVPNAIVTDTINVYPDNDTSRFVIKHVADGGFEMPHTVILGGKYQVDSDSLTDFGIIEFSPDNGITWIDLLTDTIYQNQGCYEWWGPEPILTGTSNGWTNFYVWLADFGPVFDIQFGDTIQYRFTFISDSIQTNRDGLIYDDFHFEDWMEGIQKIKNDFNSKVFPNPTSDKITVEFKNPSNAIHELTILSSSGQNIISKKYSDQNLITFDLKNMTRGIYYYKLKNQNNGQVSIGKIMRR